MTTIISGVVTNGLVVPASPLPEGAVVDISLHTDPLPLQITATELLKLPAAERDAILIAAAAFAEPYYRDDKDLTGFDAFSEEMDDEYLD